MIDLAEAQDYFGFASVEAGNSRVRPMPVQAQDEERPAPLISIVSGSGGVGRTTLALLMSALSASKGIDTVLLEGDLQFGDIEFLLGMNSDMPSLANPSTCQPVSCPLGFDIYKAPTFPEVADEVSDTLVENLGRIRAGRQLVIADTGGFWSGFTAALLLQSDLFLMVVDQRPASVASAIKASELCARIGVPSAKMAVVYNRWSTKAPLSTVDVSRSLGVGKVVCIQDGKDYIDEAIREGRLDELLASGNATVQSVRELLSDILPRVGISYDSVEGKRKGLFG